MAPHHRHAPGAVHVTPLHLHDERVSPHDLLVSREHFREARIGDVLELSSQAQPGGGSTVLLQVGAYLNSPAASVGANSTGSASGGAPTSPHPPAYKHVVQISIAQAVAQLFDFQARREVRVRRIDPATVAADYVELSFKDQYIGRGDMFRLKNQLLGTAVHVGKKIVAFGGCIRAQIKEIVVGGQQTKSGVITPETKTVFRSDSAKYFIFLQLSREMLEFNEDGDLYLDLATQGFLPELFHRWRVLGTNHVVSIVLCARVLYDSTDITHHGELLSRDPAVHRHFPGDASDTTSTWYKDFYKVVVDWETRTDWASVLPAVKEEVQVFYRRIMQLSPASIPTAMNGEPALDPTDEFIRLLRHSPMECVQVGRLAAAWEGNVLEAMNLAVNIFDKHFVDRDLSRTGLSIAVVSASPGYFVVDKKLLRLTEERMVEDGIGLDIVSLGKPPLHSVPLFRFKSSFPVAAATTSRSERRLSGNHAQFLQEKVPSSGGGGSSYPRSRLGTTPPSSQTSSSGAGGALRGSPPNYIRGTAALTASADIDTWDPLFYDRPPSASTTTADDTWFYAIPHWVDMSYHFDVDAYSANGFVPRCRMPGARQIAARSTSISAKCVPPLTFASGWPTAEEMDAYDSAIFVNHQSILGDGSHRSDRSNSPPLHMLASAATSAAATDFTTGGESSAVATPSTTPNSERLLSRSVPVALQMSRMGGSGAAIAASPPAAALRRVQRGFQASANAADTAVAEDNDTTSSSILRRRSSQITKLSTQRSALTRAVVASPSSGMAPNSPALSSPAQLYANRLIDPFRPGHNRLVRALSPHHVRRWHHVFLKKATMDTDEVLMKWRSLCTPACLPLTADYFPTQEELAELFQEYTYTISVNEEVTSYYGVGGNNNAAGGDNLSLEEVDRLRTQNLLLELISQRLVQGFQLLVGPPQQSTPPGSQQAAHLTPIGESVRLSSVSVTASPVYPSLPGSYVSHGPLHQLGFDANGSPTPFHSSPGSRRTYPASSAGLGKKLGPRGVTTATAPIYLSLGEQIHRLVYDPAAQNVEVKRYVRNLDFSAEPIHYACALWPKYVSSFVRRSATFSYPSTGSYNWNYLDQVVAGYQDDLTESIRFWRTRFILIPLEVIPQSTLSSLNPANENLNEEELRLAGFTKFLELFHKARWIDPSERHGQPPSKKGVHSGSNIPITFTTFQTSTYIANEVTAWRRARGGETAGATLPGTSAVSAPMGWLKRDVELPELARAMLHAVTGLSVKDRRWHLRFYERVLIGSECVDWLVRSFADINTREEAEEFGNVLLNTGFFDHVNKKHRFLDGHYFYRLSKEYSGASGAPSASGAAPSQTYATGDPREDKSPMRWFRSTTASSRNGIDAGQEETAALTMEPILATAATPSLSITSAQERSRFAASQRSIPRFELSRKMVIDLDPQMKSNRREHVTLHYDTVHNPKNTYHFQLHWLVCTARLVEDLLQSWSRVAERCGLRLIEAPVEQAAELDANGEGGDNPFQCPIVIQLAQQPPTIDRDKLAVQLPDLYFETELVKHFGFVLDVESDSQFRAEHVLYSYPRMPFKYTQYVHRSGVAFVQVRSRDKGGGFLWVNNRLLTSHVSYNVNVQSTAPIAKSVSTAAFSNSPNLVHPDVLRKQFEAFCGNASELGMFWAEAAGGVDKHVLLEDLTDEAATTQLIVNRGEPATISAVPDTVTAATVAGQVPATPYVLPRATSAGSLVGGTTASAEHRRSQSSLSVDHVVAPASSVTGITAATSTPTAASPRPSSPSVGAGNKKQRPAIRMFREWPLKSGAEEDSQVRRSRSFSTTVTELDAALQQSVLAANSEQLRGSRGSRVSGGDGSTSSSGHLRHDARQPIQFHPRTTTAPPLALATVAADGDLLSPLQSPLRTMLAQSPSAQTELRAASSSEEEEFTGGMEGDVLDDNDPTSASDRTTIRRSNAMPIQQPTQRYERSNSNAAVNDDVHGRSGDIMSSRRIRIAPGESGDEKEEEEATAATGDVHRMRVGIDDRITPFNDDAHGSSTTESAADDSYFRQAMRRRATKDAPREEQR